MGKPQPWNPPPPPIDSCIPPPPARPHRPPTFPKPPIPNQFPTRALYNCAGGDGRVRVARVPQPQGAVVTSVGMCFRSVLQQRDSNETRWASLARKLLANESPTSLVGDSLANESPTRLVGT
eukprot:gene19876-biopygen4044